MRVSIVLIGIGLTHAQVQRFWGCCPECVALGCQAGVRVASNIAFFPFAVKLSLVMFVYFFISQFTLHSLVEDPCV